MDSRILPVLEDVCRNLDLSGKAYREYLDNSNTFFYARQLMRYNSAIQSSLTHNKELLPRHLQEDAAALIFHYKEWTAKWLTLEKELNPADNDTFIFQNNHTFPRQAAQHLEEALKKLKEQV